MINITFCSVKFKYNLINNMYKNAKLKNSLPPLPNNWKKSFCKNYHYSKNNIPGHKRSFSASSFDNSNYNKLNESILSQMQIQSKIEQNYVNNVLLNDLYKLSKERAKIQNDEQLLNQQYESQEIQKILNKKKIMDLNKKIIDMQIKEKRYLSQEQKRKKENCLTESNKEIEEYQKLTSMEKVKNRRLQNYYRVQLHSQIISSLQNKLSKYDEISNRSRIKNKLLLNDYISTYNNINL